MQDLMLTSVLHAGPEARPAILEGQWLGRMHDASFLAIHPVSTLEGGPEALKALPAWLSRHAEQFPAGAAIGFCSYELARHFESIALPVDPDLADISFAFFPTIRAFRANPAEISNSFTHPHAQDLTQNFSEERFRRSVLRIQEYIAAGDIYQANLTQQFRATLLRAEAAALYLRLREGRARYGAYLQTPERSILSTSPERFFRISGRRIIASPIKGTNSRAGTAEEDERKRRMLLASEKDRAENLMIVDLVRNDLGRVCEYSSIRSRLFDVEALPQLYHLVSHVEGMLRPEVGLAEVLRALFPCGSITGAPKIRAMEILAKLEGTPRGVSMGAIGIIRGAPGTASFEAEFSVAIRTVTLSGNVATFNVGCGIVADSDPEAEYAEMLLKARPLHEAMGIAFEDESAPREAATIGT
jgi:aminodeoxychorismate synthase component I